MIALLLSFIAMYSKGRLEVRFEPDSANYLNFDFSSFANLVRGIRTPGYPLFLQVVKNTIGIHGLGVVQWLVWSGCVLAFSASLQKAGVSRYSSFISSFVLFFSHGVWEFCGTVGTDCLAMSLAILGVACFLWSLSEKKLRLVPLILLAIITCATYLVRPVFLFLLVLWPTLGAWLELFVFRRGLNQGGKRLVAMAVVSIVPFFAYCGLRFVVVGEFALVSFAGYNLIGIGGQYLEELELAKISPEMQPLAKRLISKRVLVDDYRTPDTFEDMEEMYNTTVWQMAVPAAEELYNNDITRMNANLQRLAFESIRLHSREYCSWLISNGLHAARQVLILTLLDRGLRLFLLSVPVLLGISFLGRRFGKPLLALNRDSTARFELSLLFWLTSVFTLGKILLIILVEPAIGRYVVAAMIYVPCLVAVSGGIGLEILIRMVSKHHHSGAI